MPNGDTITLKKEDLMKVWACLVNEDFELAYHHLYESQDACEGSEPDAPFEHWWTDEEGMDMVRQMRLASGIPKGYMYGDVPERKGG